MGVGGGVLGVEGGVTKLHPEQHENTACVTAVVGRSAGDCG